MSAPPGDPLLDCLRAGGGHVFAAVDGALVPDLPRRLAGAGLEARPLYLDRRDGATGRARGPHLVPCPDEPAFHRLRAAVPADAVVWWIWPGDSAQAAEAALYRHLRGLGMVEIPAARPAPDGSPAFEPVLFRHADPHVLVHLLPVLDPPGRARFFGQARAVVVEAARAGGLRHALVPPGLPPAPPGLLRLTPGQYEALTRSRMAASHRRIAAFLRRNLPPQLAGMTDADLHETVVRAEPVGRSLGLRSEKALGRWAWLMLLTGGGAAAMPEVRAALRAAPDPEARVRTLIDEAAAALRAGTAG